MYSQIASKENLFQSWREFRRGKRKKIDVQNFERNLEDNLFLLHLELKNKTYRHFHYTSFYITDPKVRHIHKAEVRDRIVHHAIYRILYPLFDKSFIFDSYSCRNKKGTHKAVNRLENFIRKDSINYQNPCLVLKCDIRKFFDSVDHQTLLEILKKKIYDADILWLLEKIIESFHLEKGKGIPIGNLTSQLFANIYLSELDYFIKQKLGVRYYLRYCDDLIIIKNKISNYNAIVSILQSYLKKCLKVNLHPNKIKLRKLTQGIDFLGFVILPHHRILRTKTKRRIWKKINDQNSVSYFGLLKHVNSYNLKASLENYLNQINPTSEVG